MSNLIKQDQDRLKLFKKYGYDIPKARKFILTKAKISEGKILEVGTGRGYMTAVLAKSGLKIVSIDLDSKAQNAAKLKLKSLKLDKYVSLKNMNAERLKYKDNSYDCVISVNFIHHANNPAKCLKEMARVMKDKLIIADLNKRGERIMEKVHALDGHKHVVSKMSLPDVKEYLEKAGLVVEVYKDVCQTIIIAKRGGLK
ncbi:MAG: methyltransferase domain-containing protein [Candidatus Omnitrophica bacterium]|jgi:ubiquinone/menaquinone biosynthesis C-methylase UbiE|nr:methyltransferase domain-containing protein [Candidatus Omnitrophota bacterium]